MLCHHCAHGFFHVNKIFKEFCVGLKLASIMAEIEPYSFERM